MPLLNLLQYCSCFIFQFFGCEACGTLPPRPEIKLTPPALEGKVLTSGPTGKSPLFQRVSPLCYSLGSRFTCSSPRIVLLYGKRSLILNEAFQG